MRFVSPATAAALWVAMLGCNATRSLAPGLDTGGDVVLVTARMACAGYSLQGRARSR